LVRKNRRRPKEGNIRDLANNKRDKLAQEMGWTLERAEGYLEGERYRRQRLALSAYREVGIDEYALGFRSGYYKRDDEHSAANIQKKSSAR
jgi:hypothetical protein